MMAWLLSVMLFPTLQGVDAPERVQAQVLAATMRLVDPDGGASASAVLIGLKDANAYLLTADHAVPRGGAAEVEWFTAESYPRPRARLKADRVVWRNPAADLALLRVPVRDPKQLPRPLQLRAESPRPREFPALSAGGSKGEPPTLEAVTVRGRKLLQRPDGSSAFFWQTREAPAQGRSGGPLVDLEGNLLGITSGRQQEQGYFTHLDEVRAWLRTADDGTLRWLLEPANRE